MINSVNFKGVVPTQQDVEVIKTTTTPSFKANETTSLERNPENDSFEKGNITEENHTVRNIAIGTVVALGLAAAADGIFNHGKYLKRIFGKAEAAAKEGAEGASSKPKPEPKPEIDKPNTDYENWLKEQAEKKEAITESNIKNEKWLEEQHSAKEKEYSEWWNKELNAKEAAKEAEEKVAREALEKLEQEFISKTNKEATELAKNLVSTWKSKLNTFAHIYNKGFKGVSRGKNIIVLEDGTKKVVSKGEQGTTEYLSKDGEHLDCLIKKNKDGKLEYRVDFGVHGDDASCLNVFDQNGKCTESLTFDHRLKTSEDTRIYNYYNKALGFEEEGIHCIYFGDYPKKIEWNAQPPSNISELRFSEWAEIT